MTQQQIDYKKLKKRIDELSNKHKDKRVLLYGTGKFFTNTYKNLDFSKLNIIGISDIKISPKTKKDFFGIKCFSPSEIQSLKPDVIVTTVVNPEPVIQYLNKIIKGKKNIENLIVPKKKKNGIIQNLKKYFNKSNKNSLEAEINERLKNIERKMSMPDDIWQLKNAKFYVPNYPIDYNQRIIVNNNNYSEYDILKQLDCYIPNEAIILDIGANIGNHTIYWSKASTKKVKRIHAFEPVKNTFEILKKNIEINNLENKVILYNVGLSNRSSKADFLTHNFYHSGDTHLTESDDGEMILKRLDDIELNEKRIDFIKIDVESMEMYVLLGAKETINKYKPAYIFIESEYIFEKVDSILQGYGYEMLNEYPGQNWLYIAKNKVKICQL